MNICKGNGKLSQKLQTGQTGLC